MPSLSLQPSVARPVIHPVKPATAKVTVDRPTTGAKRDFASDFEIACGTGRNLFGQLSVLSHATQQNFKVLAREQLIQDGVIPASLTTLGAALALCGRAASMAIGRPSPVSTTARALRDAAENAIDARLEAAVAASEKSPIAALIYSDSARQAFAHPPVGMTCTDARTGQLLRIIALAEKVPDVEVERLRRFKAFDSFVTKAVTEPKSSSFTRLTAAFQGLPEAEQRALAVPTLGRVFGGADVDLPPQAADHERRLHDLLRIASGRSPRFASFDAAPSTRDALRRLFEQILAFNDDLGVLAAHVRHAGSTYDGASTRDALARTRAAWVNPLERAAFAVVVRGNLGRFEDKAVRAELQTVIDAAANVPESHKETAVNALRTLSAAGGDINIAILGVHSARRSES